MSSTFDKLSYEDDKWTKITKNNQLDNHQQIKWNYRNANKNAVYVFCFVFRVSRLNSVTESVSNVNITGNLNRKTHLRQKKTDEK